MRTGSLQSRSRGFDEAAVPLSASWRQCAAGLALLFAGCSSQQLYGAGQAWQRTECQRIQNAEERSRCMQSTARSHDEYQKEAAAVKGTK
jgi:hypothetical protein